MIGRFTNLGVYRELLRSHDFYRVSFAGILALVSYVWDSGGDTKSSVGIVLALASKLCLVHDQELLSQDLNP
jgi:hypothetical protein